MPKEPVFFLSSSSALTDLFCRLEHGARGIYSGSVGFIGLNGTFDLNIIIRTAVVDQDGVHIGAGGAVVLQSDPEEEYDEMRLKASALMQAIDRCAIQQPFMQDPTIEKQTAEAG